MGSRPRRTGTVIRGAAPTPQSQSRVTGGGSAAGTGPSGASVDGERSSRAGEPEVVRQPVRHEVVDPGTFAPVVGGALGRGDVVRGGLRAPRAALTGRDRERE